MLVLCTACGCGLCFYHNKKLKENEVMINQWRRVTAFVARNKTTKLTTVKSVKVEDGDDEIPEVGASIYEYDEDGYTKPEFEIGSMASIAEDKTNSPLSVK